MVGRKVGEIRLRNVVVGGAAAGAGRGSAPRPVLATTRRVLASLGSVVANLRFARPRWGRRRPCLALP